MDVRIAERRREVARDRQSSRRRRTMLLLGLLSLLGAAFAVERSPLVELREVRVEGVTRLGADTVRDAAGLPLGTSTLRLRLGAARERVEALPLVASASVRRADPLTVVVAVVERRPVSVLLTGSTRSLVDATGQLIARGSQPGLPVIAVPGVEPPALGASVTTIDAAANAHAVLRALPGPLRAEVVRYDAASVAGLELVLADGPRVRFGRADRVAEKARVLGALLEQLAATPAAAAVAVVDVRAPTHPVVVPEPPLT